MNRLTRIKFVLILASLFSLFACFAGSKNKDLKKIIASNDYNFAILGGTEGKKINFLVLTNKKDTESTLLIVYDENYKIKNFINCKRTMGDYLSVFFTNDYLVIGRFRNEETATRDLILYSRKNKSFKFIPVNYHLIWNLFIFEDNLFYASEMANPHLNVVNLETYEQNHFDDYYCPCSEFGTVNGVVYACYENKEYFVFKDGRFVKKEGFVPDFKSEFHEVKDFEISKEIISKLRY